MKSSLPIFALLLTGCGGVSSTASAPPVETPRARVTAAAVSNTTVPLRAGWTSVGLQCQRVTALAAGNATGFAVYQDGGYQTNSLTAEAMSSGAGGRRGMFVFSAAPGNLTYSGGDDGNPSQWALVAGYNLVSLASPADVPGANVTGPIGTVVLPIFYELTPDGTSVPVNVQAGGILRAGKAYWVYSLANTRLGLPATPPAVITGLRVTPGGLTLNRYGTGQLQALDGAGADVSSQVSWTSSVPSLAAVSGTGLVTGLFPGSAVISATSGNSTVNATVVVTDQAVAPPPTVGALSLTSLTDVVAPAGGPVTLNGSGFTGATAVTFGVTPGTGLAVASDTQLTVTAPSGTGTVPVNVTTSVGTSNTRNLYYGLVVGSNINFDTTTGILGVTGVLAGWDNMTGVLSTPGLRIDTGATLTVTGTRALSVVTTGPVRLNGTVAAVGAPGVTGATGIFFGPSGLGGVGGPGGFSGGASGTSGLGPNGQAGLGPAGASGGGLGGQASSTARQFAGGGGGAGHRVNGTAGANGATADAVGGSAGQAYVSVPTFLRGGSGGGGGGAALTSNGGSGGGGGGLVRLQAGTEFSGIGVIDVRGGAGGAAPAGAFFPGGGGGGSGGSIWLVGTQAPGTAFTLIVTGGAGGSSAAPGGAGAAGVVQQDP